MMKIALVIIISFSGLLVSSANYLSFLNPATYSTAASCDDCADHVSLPAPLQFGSSCYTDAYVSISPCIGIFKVINSCILHYTD